MNKWFTLLCASAALALYYVTLCPYAFPGDSCALINMHTGVSPFVPLEQPLWGLIARFLTNVSPASSAYTLNLFSALCSAGSIALVYLVTSSFRHDRTSEERFAADSPIPSIISGIFASSVLAVALPFWIVSTRAWTLSFNLLWLLVCIRLFQVAITEGRRLQLYILTFLVGLGCTEFATMILLLPLYSLAVLYALFKDHRRIPLEAVLRLGACFLLGLMMYGFTAALVARSPSAAWRGMEHYGHALWSVWLQQYRLIALAVPKVGWLLISLTMLMPLLLILIRKKAEKRSRIWTSVMLHIVCFAIGVAVLLNTAISPWSMLKMRPMVVTPYLAMAIWMGYLGGYGWIYVQSRRDPHEPPRRFLGLLWCALLIGIIGYCGSRNFSVADGRVTRWTHQWTSEILDQSVDGRWLVARTDIEDLIMLEAKERGLNMRVIKSRRADLAYRNYLKTLFESPRLQGLCDIGIHAVFNEWAVRNPDRLKELVVVNHPDLWVVSGYRALPNRSVFDGVESVETLDLPEVLRDHQAYWATIDRDAIEPAIEHNEIVGAYLHNWLRHSSKVANNLGVLLAEEGRNDLAATCYREARRIEPDNISALLNLYALSQSIPLADHAEIEAEFETFLEELPQRIGIWALSWYYGFVRHPEAYVDRGMAWAMTARKGLAMQDLRRAMELAEDDTRMQLTLAGLHLAEQDMDASEEGYRKVLLSEPENRAALIGLVRVDILRGNFDAGRNRLQQLDDLDSGKKGALLMEWVALESMMGHFDAAREKVEQALEVNPADVTAITGLAFIAARQKDDATVEECIIKLRENVRLPAHVHLSFIQLLASMGRVDEAIHELNTLLIIQPHNLSAMEYLLNLEVRQRNRERALELVTRLLKIDPRNAYANLVMGSIQFSRGALNFSESYFVQSLESSRSPEAMNSLAYIMALDGRSLRASLLAEESLQMRPDNPNTLDTLGLAKLGLGELDAAEKAIRRSLELQPNVGETLFHLAQVYAEQGKREEAREICRDLANRMNEFPFSEHARMRDFFSTLE